MTKEFFMISAGHLDYKDIKPDVKEAMKNQAKTIQVMELWRWLVDEMKKTAKERMFESSLTYDDMLGGKMMLYTLSVMEEKLRNLGK